MAGVAIASAATSIYGQKVQGDYEVAQARNNAKLAEAQAADARQRGVAAASAITAEGTQIAGSAQTVLGASGIESTSGSAGDIAGTNAMAVARDAELARANAAREAWSFEAQVQESKERRKMVKKGTLLGGIGTGISGLGAAVEAYSKQGRG